jgi:hypothetical protein
MFLVSCAPIVTLPPAADLTPAPRDSRWEKLIGRHQVQGTLSALADIDLLAAGGRRHLRTALLLQLPAQMRMESIPVFGPPDFFLSLNREKLKIFLPGENKFYQGRPSRENLSHFLPISLPPTDMVHILLGVSPPPVGEGKIAYRESLDSGKSRLELFLNNERIRIMWSDSDVERLTELEVVDGDTNRAYRVSYSKHMRLGGNDLPQQVTIVSPDNDARIIVHYDDMELSAAGDEEAFDLAIPVKVTPISMD